MKPALRSGHITDVTAICHTSKNIQILLLHSTKSVIFIYLQIVLDDSCRWRFMGITPALQEETNKWGGGQHSHLHAEADILLPNTLRSNYSMPALSFKPCQDFCREFTAAECTHHSFSSSTIKDHLMEEYRPNIKLIIIIILLDSIFVLWQITDFVGKLIYQRIFLCLEET